jgi:hypothetical protein
MMEMPSMEHYVPAKVSDLGFTSCQVTQGLTIREATPNDHALIQMENQIVEHSEHQTFKPSHIFHIDETLFCPGVSNTDVKAVCKHLIICLNLWKLYRVELSDFYVTIDPPGQFSDQRLFLNTRDFTRRGHYDLTASHRVQCTEVVQAFDATKRYYGYLQWSADRVATALHNFWNGLFASDPTISFNSLMTILETFSNFGARGTIGYGGKKRDSVTKQILRNVRKLAPLDAHGNTVEEGTLRTLYDTRSTISHGSFGVVRGTIVTLGITHIDARFANVDAKQHEQLMSIAVTLLRRIIFDPKIMTMIAAAPDKDAETLALEAYVDALP